MTRAQHMTSAIGGDWHAGYGLAPCPVCQPERRIDQRALSLRDTGGKLLAHCHKNGCAFRDILCAAGIPSEGPALDTGRQRREEEQRANYERAQILRARAMWQNARPIEGTQGAAYLRERGITCELPTSLRWASDAYHGPTRRLLAAIVAEVSTGGIHRTFFEKTGARVAHLPKMMLGPCAGGAVVLREARGPLVVCEGIETGLSLCSGIMGREARVWAALSAPGMKALRLPPTSSEAGSLPELIVATDGDDAGRNAGEALAKTAHAGGWAVSTLHAPSGKDWNDILREGIHKWQF